MSSDFVWSPELLDDLLDGRWVNRSEFRAQRVATSSQKRVESALFVGYTDATFKQYMGDTNFVRFAPPGRRFGNLRAARRAAAQGWAVAMIVETELNVAVPQLVVRDAFAALEILAQHKRSLVKSAVIAVTGTVGKSSTLKALDAVLGKASARLSRFNVRNSLAVGMANAPIGDEGSYLLAEVSVSALWGDTSGASRFLQPDVALVTEIGLGMTHRVLTVRDTAVVKTNLIDGMPEDGVLIYNSEMKYADYVKSRGARQQVTTRSFGFDQDADYRIIDGGPVEGPGGVLRQSGEVVGAEERASLTIPALGKAHLYANTAAVAVADVLGRNFPQAAESASRYRPSGTAERIMRITDESLQVTHHIVDGTFSATPLSMRNSFSLAAQIRAYAKDGGGEMIAVLARIVALGDQAEETHLALAEPLVSAGFDRVYTYGPEMQALAEELTVRGLHAGHFDDTEKLVNNLTGSLTTHSTILLKGSKRASDFRDVRMHLNSHFEMDTVASAVTVFGHVQGVGYRKWARIQARDLGLVGWVRNSGSAVEMHVQGPRKFVREFVERCQRGPRSANVSEVIQRETRIKRFNQFRGRQSVSPPPTSTHARTDREDGEGQPAGSPTPMSAGIAPAGFEPAVVASGFGSQKLSAYVIALECWRRGLTLRFYSPDGFKFTVSDGERELSFFGSKSSMTTRQAVRAVDNKHVTLARLRRADVPIPVSRLFQTSQTSAAALAAVAEQEYRWPVVIKPVSGSRGDGVFANISTVEELKASYEHLVNDLGATRVLLEEHARGDDFRIYVVGEKVIGAVRRIPANVTGDGVRTIRQLVKAKNSARKKNPFLSKGLIRRDVEVDNMLARQGLNYDSVPQDGVYVQLRHKANASAGGDVEDVTLELPEALHEASVAAVGAIDGLAAGAVDVLWDRDAGTGSGSFVVIELNSRAHIGVNMYPTRGQGADVPRAIVDHFFPDSRRDAADRKNTLGLNLDSLLKPLREGAAAHVEVRPLPAHAYPDRRVIDLGKDAKLSSEQRARILLASRKLGVSGSWGAHEGSSRLVVAGEEQKVDDFLARVARVLAQKLPTSREWRGPVQMGFYIDERPPATARAT